MEEKKLACNLYAINLPERDNHLKTIKNVFNSVESITENPEGFTFIIPNKPDVMDAIESFISNEKKCCSFLYFDTENINDIIRLKITGQDGVKEFIKAEFENYSQGLPWPVHNNGNTY